MLLFTELLMLAFIESLLLAFIESLILAIIESLILVTFVQNLVRTAFFLLPWDLKCACRKHTTLWFIVSSAVMVQLFTEAFWELCWCIMPAASHFTPTPSHGCSSLILTAVLALVCLLLVICVFACVPGATCTSSLSAAVPPLFPSGAGPPGETSLSWNQPTVTV